MKAPRRPQSVYVTLLSKRYQANRDRIRELYDERFCRMWEIYLAAAELSFIHQNMVVFQIQLTKRPDAVPLTRDYMALSPVETGSAGRAAYPRLVR
jgi:cyclopropane-fatty-acyl-phospholipid synthase